MTDIKQMAQTIAELAKPGMRPKELRNAVRKVHPKAGKKEITRAAFYAVILAAESAPGTAESLHKLALDSRNDRSEDVLSV
jgi:hypothetical protein